MAEHKAHVAQWKKSEVEDLKKIIQRYKIIGIADMTGMPSPQLQRMRSLLKKTVEIKMSKASLMKIAFDSMKERIKGLDRLMPYIKGMPCLIFTNDNPFALAKTLKKSKSKAPAKPGQAAPSDITIPAGPTPFAPGPVIGELGQLGIKATIADGKVTIKEDAHVVKEGQVISAPLAAMLTRLSIMPMEIGINLMAVLENGEILTKEVLFIDEAKYLADLKLAAKSSFNLAFNIAYPEKHVLPLLIKKAYLDSEALADSRKILTSSSVKKIIGRAHLEMVSLKTSANIQVEERKQNHNEATRHTAEYAAEHITEHTDGYTQSNHTASSAAVQTTVKKEEEIAQSILKKLQDEKIAHNKT